MKFPSLFFDGQFPFGHCDKHCPLYKYFKLLSEKHDKQLSEDPPKHCLQFILHKLNTFLFSSK